MKYDPSLNDEQNKAVYSRGGSILVSAPAGSGKTKILVNRMMSLIEDDGIDVDSLLVLTFTKKAALEMKQRLVTSLNKRIEELEDGKLKDHLTRQIPLLNDAYITNFHTFCSDLLSQYGHAIGLDTQFSIVSDATLIKMNVFNSCMEKWSTSKKFQKFFTSHFIGYNFDDFKKILFQLDTLTHNIYQFDDYFEYMENTLYQPILTGDLEHSCIPGLILEELKDAYYEVKDIASQLDFLCSTYGAGFYYESSKKAMAPHDAIYEYIEDLKFELEKPVFQIQKVELQKFRNASWKDVDDTARKKIDDLLKKIKTTFNDVYDKCMPASLKDLQLAMKLSLDDLKTYLVYVREFQKAYQEYKKQYSYLDFNDLEDYGLQLLDKDIGVSQTLYNQFHEIMIDEYQDSATCCAISH